MPFPVGFMRAKLVCERGTRPREVLITLHRCTIQSDAFTHEHTQLPILLAYPLTINKAQGLTNGELWVANPVYKEIL